MPPEKATLKTLRQHEFPDRVPICWRPTSPNEIEFLGIAGNWVASATLNAKGNHSYRVDRGNGSNGLGVFSKNPIRDSEANHQAGGLPGVGQILITDCPEGTDCRSNSSVLSVKSVVKKLVRPRHAPHSL